MEYWRSRARLLPSFDYAEVWQAEHARAFTMAKVMRQDVLKVIYEAVGDAQARGLTLKQFRDELRPMLEAKGFWGKQAVTNPSTGEIAKVNVPQRLALVYDTNLRAAYSAGRWARIQRNKDVLPYLVYRTMGDARVRPLHASWEGTALPAEHSWWDEHYPPNGYRCRCRAYGIDDAGVAELREYGPIQDEPPATEHFAWEDPQTGRRAMVPAGIDPGWAYNPGKPLARDQATMRMVADKVAGVPAPLGATTAADILSDAETVRRFDAAFGKWVDDIYGKSLPRTSSMVAGFAMPADVAAFAAHATPLNNVALELPAALVNPTEAQAAFAAADWRALSARFRAPSAVYVDRARHTLLYVLDDTDQANRVIVLVDANASSAAPNIVAVERHALADVRQAVKSGDLELIRGAL
ncbi:minor capsid protein [Burkholderia dolosa]|uniref:phage head morphogenesis protein n=1 Tax=Burkholderia dolosa TaxID=152500 RepID=UPI001B9DF0D2|nr:phage minor head protein [Burkholderia dolosa]MBR8314660.1 minor capsid protein [Burkholderia dolosa]